MNQLFYKAAAVFAAISALSCTAEHLLQEKSGSALEEEQRAGSRKRILIVQASKDDEAVVKALSRNESEDGVGEHLHFTWEMGDKVAVYKNVTSYTAGNYVGTLTPETFGKTVTILSGELEGEVEEGDDLEFRLPGPEIGYAGQDGTFASLSAEYSLALATAVVLSVNEDGTCTTTGASFTSNQSICRFQFTDTDGQALAVQEVSIFSEPYGLLYVSRSQKGYINVTNRNENLTDPIYVALKQEVSEDPLTYVFIADTEKGVFKGTAKANLKDGRFYPATVKLAKPANNVIWYSSSNGEPLAIPHADRFGAGVTLLANEFEGGQGILTFDKDVTAIGDSAFWKTGNLISISIPETVTHIGRSAFFGCGLKGSVTIPYGATFIGDGAFCGCSGLTRIEIPETVTRIGSEAFSECRSLRCAITIPYGTRAIGPWDFYGCGITKIILPETVTFIGEAAFLECHYLTEIDIPYGVTSIEDYTFGEGINLTKVTLPETLTSIGEFAFDGCALTSITFPEALVSIGYGAFVDCRFTELTIPSNVTAIGSAAFAHCDKLRTLYVKAETPPRIGSDSFYGTGLADIYVPAASVEAYKSASVWKNFADIIQAMPEE